ncbi:hypothetical protein [Streptomyces sp. NPDC059168]|uniref:hypothetical protein n=1 Tax=Streptomyces sp. NPDC059168 TaxID=3346753 RepID=UPI0036BEBE97
MNVRPEPGRGQRPVPRDPPDQQAGPGADPLDAAAERPPRGGRTEPDEVTRTDEGVGVDERPQPDEPSA